MRPGREVDAEIAQKVMGYPVFVKKRGLFETTPLGDRPLRHYTKEIDSAWTVAEKMRVSLLPIENGSWFAIAGKKEGWASPADFLKYLQTCDFANSGAAIAETASEAVCLAALRAIAHRVDETPATIQ